MALPFTTVQQPFWIKAHGFTSANRLGPAYLTTPVGAVYLVKDIWLCLYEQHEDSIDSDSILTAWAHKVDHWLLFQSEPFSAGGPSTIKYWDGPGAFTLEFYKHTLTGTAVYDTTWHPGFYHLLEDKGVVYTVYEGTPHKGS